jgi:hypothetical protein
MLFLAFHVDAAPTATTNALDLHLYRPETQAGIASGRPAPSQTEGAAAAYREVQQAAE